jgi:hypothetical protein
VDDLKPVRPRFNERYRPLTKPQHHSSTIDTARPLTSRLKKSGS